MNTVLPTVIHSAILIVITLSHFCVLSVAAQLSPGLSPSSPVCELTSALYAFSHSADIAPPLYQEAVLVRHTSTRYKLVLPAKYEKMCTNVRNNGCRYDSYISHNSDRMTCSILIPFAKNSYHTLQQNSVQKDTTLRNEFTSHLEL
jgi:hypothetical protein